MAEIAKYLLGVMANLRLLHWQVKSYARHTASDDLMNELGGLMDRYVEAYMGRYGPLTMTGSLEIHDKVDPVKYVKSVREKMMSFKITEPDLTSVRDDMILALNRSLFLFSLK
jgi:hypothetical protein